MNTIQSYPFQNDVKVLVKLQERSFDERKATNIGISYDLR